MKVKDFKQLINRKVSQFAGGLETLVSDIVVPSVFTPYVVERTPTLSAFYSSGIIDTDAAFASLAAQGGQTVVMPFFQDLSGNSQVLSDSVDLTTKKIGAITDVAAIHNRGDAWAVNDLAKYLSGADPMAEIGDLVAAYWARDDETTLINTLAGVFAAASMSANLAAIHNTSGAITDAQTLDGPRFVNAKFLLGDSAGKLVAIAIHSAVLASLLKLDLIDFVPVTDARETVSRFQGLDVIVDDSLPTTTVNSNLVYTSYLFGRGAVAQGVSAADAAVEGGFGTWQVEFFRQPLGHHNFMINRRRFILHPRGVKWVGTPAGLSPTNGELAVGTNWTRAYVAKNIRVVKVTHNVAL